MAPLYTREPPSARNYVGRTIVQLQRQSPQPALAVRGGRLAQRPVFPERLVENGPRQGFFEHAEYEAARQYLPPPYQDVLDFAYYSGWRKREILGLSWSEVDATGGVVRLSLSSPLIYRKFGSSHECMQGE